MNALIIGATGATGKDLLDLLLADPQVDRVDIFVRKAPAIVHEKLQVHTVNFDKPDQWTELVKGDDSSGEKCCSRNF